jgi:RND family efflux transporter MFP subunit
MTRRRSASLYEATWVIVLMLRGVPVFATEFDCVTEPSATVAIRAPVEGIIASVAADRGDHVIQGQVVVTLDVGLEKANAELARFRSTMQGAIRSGESRLEYAKLKASRNEQLHTEQFVSAQDRDEAATEQHLAESDLLETRDNKRVAELEYARAGEDVRRRTVTSPINGVVVERQMNPGELADNQNAERPILKIANTSVLHVEVLLPLEAYRSVKAGMQARVMPEAPIGGEYQATVRVVDSVVDTASGTFGVRLDLPNADEQVPAGVKCRVAFDSVPAIATTGH